MATLRELRCEYSLEDALDMLEIILVADDNERKAREKAGDDAKKKRTHA